MAELKGQQQVSKEGQVIRLADIYAAQRAEEIKEQQEQRKLAQSPENNALDALERSWVGSMKLPPTDPRVLEAKKRMINGEG